MNITILSFLTLSIINTINIININAIMNNRGIIIKNKFLKLILFHDRKNMQLLKEANNFYKLCYNKSIASIAKGINDYNNLPEEEKQLIETVISLCY